MIAGTVVASIPSPSKGTLDIGPLSIHAYGLMIALGVVAAVWLLGRRLEQTGAGTREDASSVSVWGVVAGIIGARLYHVATDWSSFQHDLPRIVMIWRGGLGVPGGLLAGIAVGLWAGKRRGIAPAVLANAAAPAIPLAQAIGRWGNWFNQELFGKVTDLPWALRVSDSTALAAGYPAGTTFHPTFLYESLWNLALCAVLLAIDRRWKVRPPRLMMMYLFGYGVGRFWVEGLRIDPADHIGGFLMLVQSFWLEKRRKDLRVHLPADGIEPLRAMLRAAYLFDEILPFRLIFEPLRCGPQKAIGSALACIAGNQAMEKKTRVAIG